ncbi:hypothetical protein TrST_g1495 [Triparma strigata]|uniref:Uncharacterized protein n=1 Tax=Triparma strigata TaxID=1606541 RepID=A0A9W7EQF1_9STRA|nr:hypothetical protein TrST_g1495 [Triparma strigata]
MLLLAPFLLGTSTTLSPFLSLLAFSKHSPHLVFIATITAVTYICSVLVASLPLLFVSVPADLSIAAQFAILILPGVASQTVAKLMFINWYKNTTTRFLALKSKSSKEPSNLPPQPPSQNQAASFHLSSSHFTESLAAALGFALAKSLLYIGSYVATGSDKYNINSSTSSSTIRNFNDLDAVLILQSCSSIPAVYNVAFLSALFSLLDILNFMLLFNSTSPSFTDVNLLLPITIHLFSASSTLSNNCEIYLPIITACLMILASYFYYVYQQTQPRSHSPDELKMSLRTSDSLLH